MPLKYQARHIGKTQFAVLKNLHTAGAKGATTLELQAATGLHLRSIQRAVKQLDDRGLVKKFNLKHNKHRWYYSEVATDYLTFWPALPPHAKSSSR
jgi:DNA-binding MarR family transcriptional regulator